MPCASACGLHFFQISIFAQQSSKNRNEPVRQPFQADTTARKRSELLWDRHAPKNVDSAAKAAVALVSGWKAWQAVVFYAESVVQRSPGLPDAGGLPWGQSPTTNEP